MAEASCTDGCHGCSDEASGTLLGK
jgi:hypothetical protein